MDEGLTTNTNDASWMSAGRYVGEQTFSVRIKIMDTPQFKCSFR